ncbi:MAG: DNA-3-methyladenine glycosylase [Candidatus Saccharibacteria bacterium]|nr:DNA-3-methyladenine glycosylase [Candidatus Saccharibacteria bacterium]
MKPKASIPEVFEKSSLEVAPLLLGWTLSRQLSEGVVKLRIVETEAYHQDDPASHSFAGLTKRTAPMFKRGGHIYVYFTYGMHYALNIVTGPEGVGEAVLIRAAEPLIGIEIMRKNRGITDIKNLTNGPGKLTQALGIKDTSLSGEMLNKLSSITSKNKFSGDSGIWLEPPEAGAGHEVAVSQRIGITKAAHQPWRFYIKNSPFVSKAVHK